MIPSPELALAFSLSDWTERRKAELWDTVQATGSLNLSTDETATLEDLARQVSRRRQEAEALGARLVLPGDVDLAPLWAALPYPLALWVRGTLPPGTHGLALVGSRHPTLRGQVRARAWGRRLTEAGIPVLSGLARGIDGSVHAGALEAGPTWGIMGSGLRHPYPAEHAGLMDQIVASGGGILTPFPPEAPPRKWHFPRRNLILAAWTRGVVVLEAGIRSGTLVTARLALDLGRDIWACPGPPEDPMADGPNALLREGAARLARHPEDLLEDLAL